MQSESRTFKSVSIHLRFIMINPLKAYHPQPHAQPITTNKINNTKINAKLFPHIQIHSFSFKLIPVVAHHVVSIW